jgi:hypothetical protein
MLEPATEMTVQHETHCHLGEPAARMLEVYDQQPAVRPEHPPDFRQPRRFQLIRQVLHHQAAENNVEAGIGVREGLNRADAVVDLDAGPRGLLSGEIDHFGAGVDATDPAGGSNPCRGALGDFACAATDLEHTLAGAKASQLDGLLTHGRSSAKRHDVPEQVVHVRPMENMTCRHGIPALLAHHVPWDAIAAAQVAGRCCTATLCG